MEIPTLTVEKRKAAGSRAAGRLRRAGKLPAVLYGHGQAPVSLSLSFRDVALHLEHGVHIVNLELEKEVQPCQFKDAQYDYLGTKLVHLDLVRVDLTERIKVTVQIEFRGTPKGVTDDGGVLRHEMTELEIECIVSDVPDTVRVDLSHLEMDQVYHVKDIELPEGVNLVGDPQAAVAVVRLPAAAPIVEEEPPAEGEPSAAEPEVISKGKAEEESEDKKS